MLRFVQALAQQGGFGATCRTLQRIPAPYREMVTVEELAIDAAMSVTVTGSTPIQYGKSIRLHQARLRMLRSEQAAATAATAVGHESASQSGRGFRPAFVASH